MARTSNTIGVLGDLELGSGNKLHADFNWLGSATASDSVQYEVGDIAVDNDRIWVAVQQNNNVRPGTNGAIWHDLGDTNVLQEWDDETAYEAGNLVYRREGGDADSPALLYVALRAVSEPTSPAVNPAPETNPMDNNNPIWLRVGGQDVEILSTNRLIGNDGTVARQIYPVTRALSGSTIRYTFDTGDLEKLIDELAIPGPTLPNAGDADARSLTTTDSRLAALALNFVEFARGSTTGGTNIPFTGAGADVILRRTDANVLEITGQGTPTGTGNRDLVVNAIWTLTNPDIIAGNHVSLDVAQDSDGNAVLRISADQMALTPVAPIEISDTGDISLDFDSNALVVDDDDGLTLNADSDTLNVPTDGSGVEVRINGAGSNDITSDASGLNVTNYGLVSNPNSATDRETLRLSGGNNRTSDVDLIVLQQALTGLPNRDMTSGIEIDRTTDGDIRVTAPPVAIWAQTGSVTDRTALETIIPRSKLPNIELGNTHTFETVGTASAGMIRRAVVLNAGGQRGSNDELEWHPGDLLVIAGDDPDDGNNGVYVYIGPDQSSSTTNAPLALPNGQTYADDTNPTSAEVTSAFNFNFRAVISTDTQVQTSFSTFTDDATDTTSVGVLNDVAYSATDDQVAFVTPQGPNLVDQARRVRDEEVDGTPGVTQRTIGGFINHIKIGETVYRFGPEPELPTLRLTADPSSNEILLYRSSEQGIEYTLSATQPFIQPDGMVDPRNPTRANTITNPVYSLVDLANVRGTHTFNSATGEFTIPASVAAGTHIPLPGTLGLGASTGSVVASPLLLGETPITNLYSGPRTGTTDTRTILNLDDQGDPDPYADGTYISWQMSGSIVTVTVGGTDGMRLWEDIIDSFDNAHAGFFIAPITGEGSNDHRIQVTGTGVFTTTAGQPASDGTEIPGINRVTSFPANSGSTLLDGTDSLPVLTSTSLVRFYHAQRDGTGTRTAIGTSDYTGVMIRAAQGENIDGTANTNNDITIEITGGADATRAQNDLQTWLALTSNTGRLFFSETGDISIRKDGTTGRLTESQSARVPHRAANLATANANIQTIERTTLTAGAEGIVTDVNIPSIMYNSATDDGIAPVSLTVNFRDARVAPVSNIPTPNFVTVFNSTPAFTTLQNVDPTDGDIERGRAYDVAGWQVTGTAAGVSQTAISTASRYNYPITTAAYGANLLSSTNNTSNQARVFTFNYPMVDAPRNLQPDVDPSNTTETINYYRPWGVVVGTTEPTGATIPTLTSDYIGTPRTFNRASVESNTGAFTFQGRRNDRIYFFIPTGDLHNFDISRLSLRGVGNPFTSGLDDRGTVMAETAISGTNISYTILRASAIVQDTEAFNANLIVLSA